MNFLKIKLKGCLDRGTVQAQIQGPNLCRVDSAPPATCANVRGGSRVSRLRRSPWRGLAVAWATPSGQPLLRGEGTADQRRVPWSLSDRSEWWWWAGRSWLWVLGPAEAAVRSSSVWFGLERKRKFKVSLLEIFLFLTIRDHSNRLQIRSSLSHISCVKLMNFNPI